MAAVVVIFMQDRLIPMFMGWTPEKKGIVFPIGVLAMVVKLVKYLIFVSALQTKANESNITLCVILVVVSVLFSIASAWIDTRGTIFYAHMGVETLAKYSGVSTLVSYARLAFGVPATALFFLACGRYTVKSDL